MRISIESCDECGIVFDTHVVKSEYFGDFIQYKCPICKEIIQRDN